MTKYTPKTIPEGINSSQEHPLLGFLKTLFYFILTIALIYFVLDGGARFVFQRISLKQEVMLGTYLLNKNKHKNSDHTVELQKLTDKLWTPYKSSEAPAPHASIINESYANAFMAPGGFLQVTSMLIHQAESENELSFVLCHELGHYFHRHAMSRLSRGLVIGLISALLGFGSDNGNAILNIGVELSELTYSREQESEADGFAMQCLNDHYGHVQEFDTFFKKVSKENSFSNNKLFQYVSTHPIPNNRIEELKFLAEKNHFHFNGVLTKHNFK